MTLSRGGVPDLGGFINRIWTPAPTAGLLANHALLIGRFDTDAFNPVIWSLVHEMRISLLFPLLLLVVNRSGWKISLFLACVCMLAAAVGMFLIREPYNTGYLQSCYYVPLFILGILLAKYRNGLSAWYGRRKRPLRYRLILSGIAAYTYPHWFAPGWKPAHAFFLNDGAAALGACAFIAVSISSMRVKGILLRKPALFLGKISYSLYLYHVPVIFSFVYLFYGRVNLAGFAGFGRGRDRRFHRRILCRRSAIPRTGKIFCREAYGFQNGAAIRKLGI